MKMLPVLPVDKALEMFLEVLPDRSEAGENVPLLQAWGRVLAADVISPADLPHFARSTVDGYAVRARDTFGCTEAMPSYLDVIGEVRMGADPGIVLGEGQAAVIPTGAMLPAEADAVVMAEYTEVPDERTVAVLRPVAPGENVIHPGEDIARHQPVLRRGHRLRPQDLGALAGLGIREVRVFRRPRVAVVSTGNEIVPADVSPGPGQVRDVNAFALAGCILRDGGEPVMMGIVPDDGDALRNAIEKALAADFVLVSGGSSVGTRDLTASVIGSLGEPGVVVHGVSLRPGKPTILAVVRGKPVFGLPGHPVSALVVYELFVRPVLWRGLEGRWLRPPLKARLDRNLPSAAGREDYVRVYLREREGELWAVPVLGKSGLISTMIRADGLGRIPAAREGLEKGEWIEVLDLR